MAETRQLIGEGALGYHVVTPRGRIADGQTEAVTAPGELGEFEVLPGHVPFLTELHPGVLIIGDHQPRVYAVGRGYLRVDEVGAVEILVEQALAAESIDIDAARAELAETSDQLEDWTAAHDAAWKALSGRHDWAHAQVEAHRRAVAH